MRDLFKFADIVHFEHEDSGCALIAEIGSKNNDNVFIRLHGWDETKEHLSLKYLNGKKIEVTVRLIEE